MSKLPHVRGKEVIRVLQKHGFFIKRQSGSHVIMRHQTDLNRRCIIPLHSSQTIKPGTLYSILKGAGISIEEFVKLL
ncbi:MAG: type II toxin-antitoxin system HicA family toxin [Candidatus Omnitrophica bacterium]|nr:type II toxin-antitoxin system HicA family toxin [Candidatus Omnitrophota bacterium]